MTERETVKFVPHPETVRKYKILLMAFFLIVALLPILFVLYISIIEGILLLTITELIYMAFGYILFAVGCFKTIDILIKGYSIVYFNPKILTMNIFFELVLITPVFLMFFGFWGYMPFVSTEIAFLLLVLSFVLVLVYIIAMGFLINVFKFLSVYANLLYLSDTFEGKQKSSFGYIMSSLSKLGTAVKYALGKEVVYTPTALMHAIGAERMAAATSQTLDIVTVFTIPIIVLEKLKVKEAFENSMNIVKKNAKKIPEIFFLLKGPEMFGIVLALVALFANMIVGVLILEELIKQSAEGDVLMSSTYGLVMIAQIFLVFMIPSTLFVIYYASVGSSSKYMAIMLFYFKLKGYPVDLETIKTYQIR